MKTISDQQQRVQALDPTASFIVQAPAGSGKTELLTQRFLKLLSLVEKQPEELLAITFTRKAANEMRQRIIGALQLAKQEKPTTTHQALTWRLAKQVLQRDQQENWQLLLNPNRLRIQTIDSFCTYLSKRLPITSQLGSNIQIIEDAQANYEQVVDKILLQLEDKVPWSDAIATLLLHLDNNLAAVKTLLVNMLAHREQWLPHVINARNSDDLREHLQAALHHLIDETLTQLTKQFPIEQQQEFLELFKHAHTMLKQTTAAHVINDTSPSLFPQNKLTDLAHWQAFAKLLLTKKHAWRKSFDKRHGFPTTADTEAEKIRLRNYKERMLSLTKIVSSNEVLRQLLNESLLLPPAKYNDKQWRMLTALLELLPITAAQLKLNFQQSGTIDFTEVTQSALQALEREKNPTELALYLDYRIKHVLIDEFQDTSVTQFRLLELLVRGWQKGDGRSLFLVGDPMQSIYRFRGAEVGLFLQAKQYGIGAIQLTSLTLSNNFRSVTSIINWFNGTFSNSFPQHNDIALGAISYTTAHATQTCDHKDAIHLHRCDVNNSRDEANTILAIIKHCQQQDAEQSIAILVKTRRQLVAILPLLKQAKITFNAVEVEHLAHLPAIEDLTSLTLALQHLGDRLAWLAVLRAPWCGLTLDDLYHLANPDKNATIWQRLTDNDILQTLSDDGQKRVHRVIKAIQPALQQRGRYSLAQWVYSTWLALNGPATLTDDNQLQECERFFALLNTLEQESSHQIPGQLQRRLDKLYARSINACNLQVMTIHKAKGLEFDTVIIPSLETSPTRETAQLLLWQERPSSNNQLDLLLAPIKSHADDVDAIYDYVRHFQQYKNDFENMRLFYVAVTRAKQHLHLLANFDNSESKPRKNSFLHAIWQQHRHHFKRHHQSTLQKENTNIGCLRRLVEHVKPAKVLMALLQQHPGSVIKNNGDTTMPAWQDTTAVIIGTVLHFILQQLGGFDPTTWSALLKRHSAWQVLLKQQGLADEKLENAKQLITTTLKTMLHSKRAHWLFSHQHQDIYSEYRLSYKAKDKINHVIIDRTFVANNIRWIIDFKFTTTKKDESLTHFLQQQQNQHREQLQTYAEVLTPIEDRLIKLGLYFPLLDAWIEWSYVATVSNRKHKKLN